MSIVFLISFIILSVAGAFSVTKYLHMLQQNSYFNSRYFRWLKGNAVVLLVLSLVLVVMWALFVVLNWVIPSLALSVLCACYHLPIARLKQKKAIKPLVFTARVKRMYVTYGVICAVLLALGFAVSRYCYLLVAIWSIVTTVTAMLLIVINSPIEALIRQYYLSDAKRILKSNGGMTVIGITGSYGKTSTKYILARILQEQFNVLFTPGSFNTPMGVVRTIREMMKPTHEIFVCEMGAKNVGDIKEICDIVHPDMALITSVGPQHLETFRSIENVTKTKFELADAVLAKNGKIYLNLDNEYIAKRSDEYNAVGYAQSNADALAQVYDVQCSRYGTQLMMNYRGHTLKLTTKLLGQHNVLNIAGAVAIALDLGVSDKDIQFAVEHLEPISHRLELKKFVKGSLLIDDAYNANPSGSQEALNVLDRFDGLRKIVVTPGMVELGDAEYEENYKLGQSAAKKDFDIILVGEERAKPLADGIRSVAAYDINKMQIVSSFQDAMNILNTMLDDSCVVLFENDLPDNYAK